MGTGNFITTWTRDKAEPVYWSTGAGHQGGYAYRLCKIPSGGVTQITEECFNQGHLYFAGDTNWIYAGMKPYSEHDYSKWEEVPAVITTEGTYPPGSEWTKINVEKNKAKGWGFKDYVQIPEDIEPGSYILSFRWDSQATPQVWSNCANIEVLTKELRKKQQDVKDKHQGNLKQKKSFCCLEKLMKVKLKVAKQEMQNLADGRPT